LTPPVSDSRAFDRDAQALGGCARTHLIDFPQQDNEFLASEARHLVGRSGHIFDYFANAADDRVPHRMTGGVIDPLEMVYIDDEQTYRALITPEIFQRIMTHGEERSAVHQVGQGIGVGELPQGVDVVCELRRVLCGAQVGLLSLLLRDADAPQE
jgi:hypothetical protein